MAGLCEDGNEPPGSLKANKQAMKLLIFLLALLNICSALLKYDEEMQKVQNKTLANYISNITRRYFTPGQIVFSIPTRPKVTIHQKSLRQLSENENHDVANEVINNLSQDGQYSFTVTQCGDTDYDQPPQNLLQPDNYIIFTSSYIEFDEILENSIDNIQSITGLNAWNPKANILFVVDPKVVAANPASEVMDMVTELFAAQGIFNSLFIIQSKESFTTETQNSTFRLETYGWLPEMSQNACLTPKEIYLVDRYDFPSTSMFDETPIIIQKPFCANSQLCPLKVAVAFKDYDMIVNEKNESVLHSKNPEAQMLEEIFKKLNLTLNYLEPHHKGDTTTAILETIGAVMQGTADIAIGQLSLTGDSNQIAEYTYPHDSLTHKCQRREYLYTNGRQHSLKCVKGKQSRPMCPVVQQEEVESIPASSYECTIDHSAVCSPRVKDASPRML
ncbi:hypothetical protein ANN_00645 [Periplaneta americana]|uniref:Uncharacterized protein n=1 Tax=Periplaneta americana TaxID=6978 RepID=A0ABQ8TRC9_PERAM|nr:hypothetical protein ANN_00645 [Periplaneta americana]